VFQLWVQAVLFEILMQCVCVCVCMYVCESPSISGVKAKNSSFNTDTPQKTKKKKTGINLRAFRLPNVVHRPQSRSLL
jgi:hypothetical protein